MMNYINKGFPGGTMAKNPPASEEKCKKYGFKPWLGNIPWSRKWQPTPEFLPGKFHGQRSLAGYSPRDHKEADMTEPHTTNYVNKFPNIDKSLHSKTKSHC